MCKFNTKITIIDASPGTVSTEVNLLRMGLVLGWGTAANSFFFFKLDLIFYFVWPLKAIFLINLLSTLNA